MDNKQYFTMIQVRNALEQIADKMSNDKWEPDVIMGINRGGCIPGIYLSHRLNKPHEALDVRLSKTRSTQFRKSICVSKENIDY